MNVRRIITFAFAFAIVALTVGLSGCEKIAPMVPDTGTPPMTGKGIPIGVVVDLTGPQSEPYGIPMKRGFDLALEEINNAQTGDTALTFITIDDQGTVEGATAAFQQLVNQGVPAIVGIALSTQFKPAAPIAQENGVIAFSSLSAATGLSSIGDFVFRAAVPNDILVPAGVMATHEKLGYEKVALMYDDADVYSTDSNEEIRKALEASGVEILTEETFQTTETDFSMQLTNIMEMQPDAIFVSGLEAEITQIISQGGKLGITDAASFIVPYLDADDVQKVGDAAEGAVTFAAWNSISNTPGNQAFIQNYRAKYGIEPDTWAAQSYATLYILANAIANAQSTDSVAIRDALAQTMDFPTILGNFSFDPNGEAVYDPIVLMVKDGELQLFE